MNRCIFLGTILLALVCTGQAQEHIAMRDTDDCRAFLTLGGIMSYGVSRDQGVSPIAYQILALSPHTALNIDYREWEFNVEMTFSAYIQTKNLHLRQEWSIKGYGADIMLLSGFDYRLFQSRKYRIKVGLAGTGWLTAAYNNSFMNACVGVSGLVAPLVRGTVEMDVGRFTLHAVGGTAPIGWWYRPGFAYISNYSSGKTEVETFNDDYHWNTTPFPLLKTELGCDFHFERSHSLGVMYSWHFLSSRNSGYWTYEAARHHLWLMLRIAL